MLLTSLSSGLRCFYEDEIEAHLYDDIDEEDSDPASLPKRIDTIFLQLENKVRQEEVLLEAIQSLEKIYAEELDLSFDMD